MCVRARILALGPCLYAVATQVSAVTASVLLLQLELHSVGCLTVDLEDRNVFTLSHFHGAFVDLRPERTVAYPICTRTLST